MMRTCFKCKVEKPSADFTVDKHKASGFSSYCKMCTAANARKWREANREQARESWRKTSRSDKYVNGQLMRKYGINLDDYRQLLASQDSRCAICNIHEDDAVKGRLFIDHCHTTGVVRGLLCHQCNAALGLLQDDIDRLQAAVNYLAVQLGCPASHKG